MPVRVTLSVRGWMAAYYLPRFSHNHSTINSFMTKSVVYGGISFNPPSGWSSRYLQGLSGWAPTLQRGTRCMQASRRASLLPCSATNRKDWALRL